MVNLPKGDSERGKLQEVQAEVNLEFVGLGSPIDYEVMEEVDGSEQCHFEHWASPLRRRR